MTKEEIALQHGLCTCDNIYTSRGMKAPDCPWHARAVEEAMDAYARQEAAGFAEWCYENACWDSVSKVWSLCASFHNPFPYDTETLFKFYLTHKNKSDVKS